MSIRKSFLPDTGYTILGQPCIRLWARDRVLLCVLAMPIFSKRSNSSYRLSVPPPLRVEPLAVGQNYFRTRFAVRQYGMHRAGLSVAAFRSGEGNSSTAPSVLRLPAARTRLLFDCLKVFAPRTNQTAEQVSVVIELRVPAAAALLSQFSSHHSPPSMPHRCQFSHF